MTFPIPLHCAGCHQAHVPLFFYRSLSLISDRDSMGWRISTKTVGFTTLTVSYPLLEER